MRRSLRKRKRRVLDNDSEELQIRREDDHGMSNDKDEGLEISLDNTPKAGGKGKTMRKSLSTRRMAHNQADEVQFLCILRYSPLHWFLKNSNALLFCNRFQLGF